MQQPPTGKPNEQVAGKIGVGSRYVCEIKKIKAEAPELIESIRSGEISVKEAKAERTAELRERGEDLEPDYASHLCAALIRCSGNR